MRTILLVEDEKELRFSLAHNLQFEGYKVVEADDGLAGLRVFQQDRPDLVVMDIMMPQMDGLATLKEIRKLDKQIPVMLLTARSSEMDKVIGFELGADDYLTKPFSLGEFLARVKALLRRGSRPLHEEQKIAFHQFEMDLENFSLKRDNEEIHLSQKEFQLLKYLAQNPGKALEKKDILVAVWGYQDNATTRTIDTHIARIRRKLGDQDQREIIQTVPTIGYRFVAPIEPA
ncbi:MAG: response regulator transcription factor [Acidobacteria bacterium]|nr:response regulator transcription factor [Acidobacteriota bacterium]MCB9398074.1 response regulator transcription factor [Acidobacteriota bacterium]